MKVFNDTIRLQTTQKSEDINISSMVEAIVHESDIYEGTATIFTGHTTAGIHLNNADPELAKDLHDFLSETIPNKPSYRHNKGDYGRNAHAHFKSLLIGNSVTIPINKGRIALGQWQAIYFSEFDGPRNRLISVKAMGIPARHS
ncbi:MAG: YjbQ family protein [Deltaproteobacteria bacterium]|nr:YjbQ family protein [Deltaproteobacteria bacterium]